MHCIYCMYWEASMFSSGLLVVQYKMIKAFVSESFYKIKGTVCSSCVLDVLYCMVLCERAHGRGRGASQYSGLVWHCVQVEHWVQEHVLIGVFVLCILFCTCWWVLEWLLTALVNYSYPWKGQPIDRVLMEEVRKRCASLCGVESHISVYLIVTWPTVMCLDLLTYVYVQEPCVPPHSLPHFVQHMFGGEQDGTGLA